jgi:hypothetical protein
MFKFNLGQTVYFMYDNKLNSAVVTSRMLIENLLKEDGCRQKNSFDVAGVKYATNAGTFSEKQLFASVDEVFESLADNVRNW